MPGQRLTRQSQALDADERKSFYDYTYEHFKTRVLLEDGRRTIEARGIEPGVLAPDFELPEADGGSLRLSSLRGKPVILHFGSFS